MTNGSTKQISIFLYTFQCYLKTYRRVPCVYFFIDHLGDSAVNTVDGRLPELVMVLVVQGIAWIEIR